MNLAIQTTILLAEASKEGVEFSLDANKLCVFTPGSVPLDLQNRLKVHEDVIKVRIEYDAGHSGSDGLLPESAWRLPVSAW